MSTEARPELLDWVVANLLPFESELRATLQRHCRCSADVDDIVQEIYYRVLRTASMQHVRNPKGFLVQAAKNILLDRHRHETVVAIDSIADLHELAVADEAPTPERVALARAELAWVMALVATLPARCQKVFRARRLFGFSQRETAQALGITENVVEKETIRGIRLLADMMSRARTGPVADGPAGRQHPVASGASSS